MTQKTLTKPFNELTPQELERRKNFDCGIESIKISEDKYQLIHDDSYYNESYTKEELLLFLKEIEIL